MTLRLRDAPWPGTRGSLLRKGLYTKICYSPHTCSGPSHFWMALHVSMQFGLYLGLREQVPRA